MLTKEQFDALIPYTRGFVVYTRGNDPDEPNVPAEQNPYPLDTDDHKEWNRGQLAGVHVEMDSEE